MIDTEKLRSLKHLLDEGVLSEEEFKREKQKILQASDSQTAVSLSPTPAVEHEQKSVDDGFRHLPSKWTLRQMVLLGREKAKDERGTIFAACMLYLFVHFAWHFSKYNIFDPFELLDPSLELQVFEVLFSLASAPLGVGIFIMGVRRAYGLPFSFKTTLETYRNFIPLMIIGIILWIVVFVGSLLLVIPGIYAMVTLGMAPLLHVERGLPPIEAIKASHRGVLLVFWRVLGLYIYSALFVFGVSLIIGFCLAAMVEGGMDADAGLAIAFLGYIAAVYYLIPGLVITWGEIYVRTFPKSSASTGQPS